MRGCGLELVFVASWWAWTACLKGGSGRREREEWVVGEALIGESCGVVWEKKIVSGRSGSIFVDSRVDYFHRALRGAGAQVGWTLRHTSTYASQVVMASCSSNASTELFLFISAVHR